MNLAEFIYTYLLGGLTFLPLVVFVFVYAHPKVHENDCEDEQDAPLKAGEIEEKEDTGIGAYKSGWITVTQEYLESTDDITNSTQSISESHDNKTAYASLYKIAKNSDTGEALDNESASSQSPVVPTQSTEKVKSHQKKHRFFGVLKHGNLFLYNNSSLKDVKNVIVLSNHIITLWPRNITDGQLFTRRTNICLIKKDWSRTRRLSENFGNEKLTVDDILDASNGLQPPKSSFFIHCDTNIEKEDWYFALIRASKIDTDQSSLSATRYARTLHFDTHDMMDLIQTLYSTEGQLHTKWLNALIGRMFLAFQKTKALDNFLKDRISKKLNKIKTPGFLDKFQLGKLHTGMSAPFFTYPTLKEINPNGALVFGAYVHYHGCMSCNISTKVNIGLGSRFKTREVDVVLAVTLQKLEGPVIFKIKPPPSERVWYAFEIEPIMNLKIEPIISSRQMSYNIITNSIEKKFKEAVKESLVVPHFDDLVFYDTMDEKYRGGIWDHSVRDEADLYADETDTESLSSPIRSSPDKSPPESIASFQSNGPMKFGQTLSDLSKKIKKSKSSHTVGINGESWLSDGSILEKEKEETNDSGLSKTLKKIGSWYNNAKDDNAKPLESTYHRPEMIANRRQPRYNSQSEQRASVGSSTPMSTISPSFEMFTKSTEPGFNRINHSRADSRYSTSSTENSLNNYIRDENSLNENSNDGVKLGTLDNLKQEPVVEVTNTTAHVSADATRSYLQRQNTKLHRKPPTLTETELENLEQKKSQTASASSDGDSRDDVKATELEETQSSKNELSPQSRSTNAQFDSEKEDSNMVIDKLSINALDLVDERFDNNSAADVTTTSTSSIINAADS